MITANKIKSKEKGLRSWEFNQKRAELELYQVINFPECGKELRYSRNLSVKKEIVQSLIKELHDKKIDYTLTCNRKLVFEGGRYVFKSLSKNRDRKDIIREICQKIFNKSCSLEELKEKLEKQNLKYYKSRGKIGVLDLELRAELEKTGKTNPTQDKYSFRFDNLGLVGDYNNILEADRSSKEIRGRVRKNVFCSRFSFSYNCIRFPMTESCSLFNNLWSFINHSSVI